MRMRSIPQRRAFAVSAEAQIETIPPGSGKDYPLAYAPALRGGVNALAWARSHKETLRADLVRHGAVLLRGFAVESLAEMEQIIEAVARRGLVRYEYQSSPRTRVEGRIYTSTEYPPDQCIPFHNEMSYALTWPRLICFWCRLPAEEGGETPLADSHAVLNRLDPAIRRRFLDRGVLYVRNYGVLDLPWQVVFQTERRAEVERYCARAGIECEWRGSAGLRTRQVCPAVVTHPETGQEVWFNQAHLFHVSGLQREVRDALLSMTAVEDLPRNAYYGDGSPIEDAVIAEINAAYAEEACSFPWEAGDLLIVDNLLRAHGRRPFRGRREVLVGMA